MSVSFYEYIVNSVLAPFFRNGNIQSGNKYYIVIEDRKKLSDFSSAFKKSIFFEPLTINNIFNGGCSEITEQPYQTIVSKTQDGVVPVIIANSEDASEDYLTTLRNSIGTSGSKYENYAIFYILSKNRLESLTTSSVDLQSKNYPLSAEKIGDNIRKELNEKVLRRYEQFYINHYIDKLTESINEGNNDLFEFENVLSVLQKGSIKDDFDKLGFFPDAAIYNESKKFSEAELKKRVKDNGDLFLFAKNIMDSIIDPQDQEEELSKKFDDRSSAALIRKEDSWQSIDFANLKLRKKTNTIYVSNIDLVNEDASTRLIKRGWSQGQKKSKVYIIVCDPSGKKQTVRIDFSENVSQYFVPNSDIEKRIDGKKLYISAGEENKTYSFSVCSDNSRHDFFILKTPAKESYLKGISQKFKLKKGKKSQIIIDVPAGDCVQIGDGSATVECTGIIDWDPNYRLYVPDEGHDEEKQLVAINFGASDQSATQFLFAVSQSIPRYSSPLEIFKTVWNKKICMQGVASEEGEKFHKLRSDENEYYIKDFFKKFLRIEDRFVREELLYLDDGDPIDVKVADSVRESLFAIYAFFREHNTVPSLCYVDDSLETLYTNYINAVLEQIESLPTDSALPQTVYNLTMLGIVRTDEGLYEFTPFNPIVISFLLKLKSSLCKQKEDLDQNIIKLLSATYLIPYLSHNGMYFMPYQDSETEGIKTWLFYENVKTNIDQKEKIGLSTTKTVVSKMQKFIEAFPYFFSDKDSPLKIATVGISDDINLIKGVIKFICSQLDEKQNISQKIEIHEYVKNINEETYYEKLNRLCSDETRIVEELSRLESSGIVIENKDRYTVRDLIRILFTRVDFFKHKVDDSNDVEIYYCHLLFYRIDSNNSYIIRGTKDFRTELSMGGLVSVPSTANMEKGYALGFGTASSDHIIDEPLFRFAKAMNVLYANERNNGRNMLSPNSCVAKFFDFVENDLLNQIYEKANWVVFLDPEVGIDFFYRQPDVYIVHFTDQYTINAKYDGITVTKHVEQYRNLIKQAYCQVVNDSTPSDAELFYKTMTRYFNSLNGEWLLGVVCNKNTFSVREKLSMVAACKLIRKALQRNKDILWIPISLDQILRVTGSINLPQDSPFSKKSFKLAGAMSDDLLFIGVNPMDKDNIKVYFYPVEVKASSVEGSDIAEKGEEQVVNTYNLFLQHIIADKSFERDVYSTLFLTQYLSNVDKLYANDLILKEEYDQINSCRFELLNMRYDIEEFLPEKKMGKAGLVSFIQSAPVNLRISVKNSIPICNFEFDLSDCLDSVTNKNTAVFESVGKDAIVVNPSDELYLDLSMKEKSCLPPPSLQEDWELGRDSVLLESRQDSSNESNSLMKTSEVDVKDESSSTIVKTSSQNAEAKDVMRILVGHTMRGEEKRSPVYFEPNNTNQVPNPNFGIVGTMGTGKTQFAKSLIAQIVGETSHNIDQKPIGILIFDYKGDYNNEEFLAKVNGQCFKENFPFNPLKLISDGKNQVGNLPALTADKISDSMARSFGMGIVQKSTIKNVIVETYKDFGITRDQSTWGKEPPTMADVVEKYWSTCDERDKAYALFDKLRDYDLFTSEKKECISLFDWLKGVRVIDLSGYSSEETKKVIVALILDIFYAEMQLVGKSKLDGNIRQLQAMIMVDEASAFMKCEFDALRRIITQGREFGVGVILSTQYISDFRTSDENYSQFINSWMLHQVNNVTKQESQLLFGNDPRAEDYTSHIVKSKKFYGICKISGDIKYIRGLPFFELEATKQ